MNPTHTHHTAKKKSALHIAFRKLKAFFGTETEQELHHVSHVEEQPKEAAVLTPKIAHAVQSHVATPVAQHHRAHVTHAHHEPVEAPAADVPPTPPAVNTRNNNLVGKEGTNVKIDGKTYNVSFRTDSIYIDAKKYEITSSGAALGGDVQLDLYDVRKEQDGLHVRIGAFGKESSFTCTNEECEQMLRTLISGRRYKRDVGSQSIEISPVNY